MAIMRRSEQARDFNKRHTNSLPVAYDSNLLLLAEVALEDYRKNGMQIENYGSFNSQSESPESRCEFSQKGVTDLRPHRLGSNENQRKRDFEDHRRASSYECKSCGRMFDRPTALGGHRANCKSKFRNSTILDNHKTTDNGYGNIDAGCYNSSYTISSSATDQHHQPNTAKKLQLENKFDSVDYRQEFSSVDAPDEPSASHLSCVTIFDFWKCEVDANTPAPAPDAHSDEPVH